MRNNRRFSISSPFLLLIASLALLGVGYALWSQVLTIRGQINTGNLSVAFSSAFTDDDGVVDMDELDGNDVGDCPVQAGGATSCDPAASGADPKDRHDKDVANCRATVSGDGSVGEVTKNNAYPGYFCTAWFQVNNLGNVPVRIASARIQGKEVLPSVTTPFDLNNDGQPDVAIHLTGFDVCQQVDPSQRTLIDIDQEILQPAPEGRQLSYTVELQFNQWNEDCFPPNLPVFEVTGPELTAEQADTVAEALGIPSDQMAFENGVALFVDPVAFQAAPMTALAIDPGQDEDEGKVVAEAFDREALSQIQPISGDQALQIYNSALDKAGIIAPTYSPVAEVLNTSLQLSDLQGNLTSEALLDTQLRYSFRLGGLPMIGQGAQQSVAFSPSASTTAWLLALPASREGEAVPIISPSQATEQCREQLGPLGKQASISPSLVYYVPDLALEPNTIIAHWDCGGTVRVGDEQAILLNQLLPAVDDPKYVAAVELEAETSGTVVSARAIVEGGTPPYNFSWTATSADLSGVPQTATSVQYDADPKVDSSLLGFVETVSVAVTDANGVQVQANQMVELKPPVIGFLPVQLAKALAKPFLIPGRADFGIERAVSDMCANNVNRYSSRMDDESTKQFHWTGQNAWERDFKEGGTGLDHIYVDNVDETFYCGHGWGGGFTFESNQDDGSIVPADAASAWGDGDLEWLALLSCQVLKGSHGGQSWAARWGPSFDGLHLLLGFETNAYDWSNFGKRFAQYQLGRNFLFFTRTLPVRSAWFQAAIEDQPDNVKSVVMGVGGPNGMVNYNDFFHGQGPIGPDIPKSQIQFYWRIVLTT